MATLTLPLGAAGSLAPLYLFACGSRCIMIRNGPTGGSFVVAVTAALLARSAPGAMC